MTAPDQAEAISPPVHHVSGPLPLERPDDPRLVDELSGPALRKAMSVVTLSWVFGSVWFTAISGAPLTLFAKHLDASKFEFGLLSALPFIASLASMPSSWWTERTGQRKRMFLSGLYTQRLLWFPIALVPTWIAIRLGATGWAMTIFLVLVFLMHVAGN